MKPLFRWTLGPVSQLGLNSLKLSVKNIKSLYPNADFVITYNQTTEKHLKCMKSLNVSLIDQEIYLNQFNLNPEDGYNVHWKLFPGRLELDRHEIYLDNDVIIEKQIEEIDWFLQSKEHCLTYQGLYGLYGCYDFQVPKSGIHFNSGIYGVPPKFDLNAKIQQIIKGNKWLDRFDEQGIFASIFSNTPYFMIPLTKVPIVQKEWLVSSILNNQSIHGYHFVDVNTSETHLGFKEYQNILFSNIKFLI
jgi:hypothetical protein